MKMSVLALSLFTSLFAVAQTEVSHRVLGFSIFSDGPLVARHSSYTGSIYSATSISLTDFSLSGSAETAGTFEMYRGRVDGSVVAAFFNLQQASVPGARLGDSNQLRSRSRFFQNEVRDISARLGGLAPNTNLQVLNGHLQLNAFVSGVTVVNVDASLLESRTNLILNGAPSSLIVVQIQGSSLNLVNKGILLYGLSPDQVVFHSASLTQATLAYSGGPGTGLGGSWILPNANVTFANANVQGHLVVGALGQGEYPSAGAIGNGCFRGFNQLGVGCR